MSRCKTVKKNLSIQTSKNSELYTLLFNYLVQNLFMYVLVFIRLNKPGTRVSALNGIRSNLRALCRQDIQPVSQAATWERILKTIKQLAIKQIYLDQ